MKLSVVVCVRNEEARLRECLRSVYANNPDEVILVDGDSADGTLGIAREFKDIKIIESKNSTLPRDRQIGIDAARNDLIAMIDGDHRLRPDDLVSLIKDMEEFQCDIVQSCVIAFNPVGYWSLAANESWELIHNRPGIRNMIGTAPAIYKKNVFNYARFDDNITKTIEDTDFSYRLSKFPEIRLAVGRTKISQYHFADFNTYVKKFKWYGKGDGEFCRKYPRRMPSMIFHLLIRYPILYPIIAIKKRKIRAIPFFILEGSTRFLGAMLYFVKK
jgi:glycosyltransferase involved in cell wall biosynthesis